MIMDINAKRLSIFIIMIFFFNLSTCGKYIWMINIVLSTDIWQMSIWKLNIQKSMTEIVIFIYNSSQLLIKYFVL